MGKASEIGAINVEEAIDEAPHVVVAFMDGVVAAGFDPHSDWHCETCGRDFEIHEMWMMEIDNDGTSAGEPVCPNESCSAVGIKAIHPQGPSPEGY